MLTNNPVIRDSNLMNSINSQSYSLANKGLQINRSVMLSNYNESSMEAVWDSMVVNIIQNYERGRGTVIKNFGTFTFKKEEYSLEGTTNQFQRDKKPKNPVFVVSKEFNRECSAGEYTKQGTIKYYIQKENKDVPHVKLNFAEMAYSISMSKDEVMNILSHLFKYISESIDKGEFKNKNMKGLGVLICRNRILAVKFLDNFTIKNKEKNQKLIFTKKNIFLDMDLDKAQKAISDQCLTPYQNVEDLKAKNALITKCDGTAEEYLKSVHEINIKKFPQHEIRNIYNDFNKNSTCTFKFFNDNKSISSDNKDKKINGSVNDNGNIKISQNVNNNGVVGSSPLFFLDEEILKQIEYFKGVLIVNNKNYDMNRNGLISKDQAVEALVSSGISPKIDNAIARSIVDYYNKADNVEYMKFIAQIIKDSRNFLLKRMKRNNSTLNSVDYNSFKRENFFLNNTNNNQSINSNGGGNSSRFMKSNKTQGLNKSCSMNFYPGGGKNNKSTPHLLKKIKNTKYNNTTNVNNLSNSDIDLNIKAALGEIDEKNEEDDDSKSNIYGGINLKNLRYQKSSSMSDISNNGGTKIKNKTLNNGFFYNRHKETESNKKQLLAILNVLNEIHRKYYCSLDQKISYLELVNILKKYDIVYPKNKIAEMLIFLGVPDITAFTLRSFENYVRKCKIIETKIELKDLDQVLKTIKDVIYVNGGLNLFFNNELNHKDTLNCETFIKILKDKVPYDEEVLKNVFLYLVKTDRDFNITDFYQYFNNYSNTEENDKTDNNNNNGRINRRIKNGFDDNYCLKMMQTIIQLTNDLHLKAEEYFNRLLGYNISTEDKVITRYNWIKYLQKEKLKFSAEELDNLFNWLDIKGDEVLDADEFITKYNYCQKPLTELKDIINMNKLDIEDLAHRMGMKMKEIEKIDYQTFRAKLKNLDNTFSEERIKKIFDEVKQKDFANGGKEYIDTKKFLDEINYIKPAEKYSSFIENYMKVFRSKIDYKNLKTQLEKYDKECRGTLTKIEYVTAVSNIIKDFTDDEHMKFARITDMFDKDGNVTYPELLNLIYFYNKGNLNDPFSKLCQFLSDILVTECDGDIEKLMFLIEIGVATKTFSLIVHKPLNVNQVKYFLNTRNFGEITNAIIQKLDIDADGLISYDDLKSVLKRYLTTSFFKYSNDSTSPNIDLFSKENLPDLKISHIISKLKYYMKFKNITEIGLFKKFDVNEDGFISNVDFNEGVDDIIKMSPAIKDQFFNYLDFYHNGMVDMETFVARMNGEGVNGVVQNNNKIENEILEKMKEFILKNNKFSDNEIFQVIDKDCDGLINLEDFKKFVMNNLNISSIEFNKAKLERVMMSLSLTKNLQIGINDIREFINLCNELEKEINENSNNKNNNNMNNSNSNINEDNSNKHMNLKEVFKICTNQNLSSLKKNKEWTNDVIERLGMFISEKYDSLEQWFDLYSQPGLDKLKYSDFLRFQEDNYEMFNNGFNLTKDELLSIFTSLDSQKKNYLTLQDVKNKLQIFNFYNKMHIDVRNFLQENFANGRDAFKFFIKSKNDLVGIDNTKLSRAKFISLGDYSKNNTNINNIQYPNGSIEKHSITLKEFFDAFENFFPGKYSTNTILKYLNKYFNININNSSTVFKNKSNLLSKKETIDYREFNYIYFDQHDTNENFIQKKNVDTKLMSNRIQIGKSTPNKMLQKSQNNFYYSNLFKKKFDSLSTPFDNDPLDKVKRLICSSKYNLNKFFEDALSQCQSTDYIVNKYQFRNIIKSLGIGLTNLEIDQIMFQCGKVTYDDKINLKEFVKYLFSLNQVLEEGKTNVAPIIGEIKSLIYKYYSNPVICFQNNDIEHRGKIDFEKFKNLIFDMYRRNNQTLPNFILVKNAYDTIDLRKDGMIDMNEWCKTFGNFNGKLDVDKELVSNGNDYNYKDDNITTMSSNTTSYSGFSGLSNFNKRLEQNRKTLREWETSSDVTEIYKYIYKNRKLIKNRIYSSNYIFDFNGEKYVQGDNLLAIIKSLLPGMKLSQTQWKMVVNIAKSESNENLIDINEFFRLMEITSKNLTSHPKLKVKNKLAKSINDYSSLGRTFSQKMEEYNNRVNNLTNNLGFGKRRCFSIGKDNERERVGVNIVNFDTNFLPNNY